jgi:hypothetical protein
MEFHGGYCLRYRYSLPINYKKESLVLPLKTDSYQKLDQEFGVLFKSQAFENSNACGTPFQNKVETLKGIIQRKHFQNEWNHLNWWIQLPVY